MQSLSDESGRPSSRRPDFGNGRSGTYTRSVARLTWRPLEKLIEPRTGNRKPVGLDPMKPHRYLSLSFVPNEHPVRSKLHDPLCGLVVPAEHRKADRNPKLLRRLHDIDERRAKPHQWSPAPRQVIQTEENNHRPRRCTRHLPRSSTAADLLTLLRREPSSERSRSVRRRPRAGKGSLLEPLEGSRTTGVFSVKECFLMPE